MAHRSRLVYTSPALGYRPVRLVRRPTGRVAFSPRVTTVGSVFRKSYTKPVPADAAYVEKNGERFARFRDRDRVRTVRVTSGTDGGPRLLIESGTYTARYRDASGALVERATGCRDEANARRRLTEWEREVERIRAGVLTAADVDMSQHSRTTLEARFTAFDTRQHARGMDDKYRENTLRSLRRVAADCGFRVFSDLRAEPFESWLVARTEAGSSARTRNLARESWLVFLNWCVETGRLTTNPFAGLSKANAKADPRRQRRPLTEDELGRLLAVARTRPLDAKLAINRGVKKGEAGARLTDATRAALDRAGRERALVYKTLVLTGLRKSELGSLTVEQVRLDDRPHLSLAAADEKARRGALVPLRGDLADDLRNWLAERLDESQREARHAGRSIPTAVPSDALLFSIPLHLIRNLKKDLAAAGIAERDGQGFVIDLHSMRHTFATMLAKGGIPQRVAQELMRHSDPRLTANVYTHLGMTDTRSALDSLPSLSGSAFGNSLAPLLALTPYKQGQNGASPDKMADCGGVGTGPKGLGEKAGNVNGNGPLTTCVISGPSQVDLSQEVAAVGFEPSSRHTWAGFGSHRCRVEFSSAVSPCVTDQASVTMLTRWGETGNTAHPLPTLCPPRKSRSVEFPLEPPGFALVIE